MSDALDHKLEILTDQIGRLTEGLTDIKSLVDRVAVTTEQQAENIKQQSENINWLVSVVDRQSQMLDKLMERDRH
jgi:methyl-accepting chemotaxis protein